MEQKVSKIKSCKSLELYLSNNLYRYFDVNTLR